MDEGITMATHLFNAMGPLHHRDPGIVRGCFGDKRLFLSIIADGVHVLPRVLKVAWNAQPEGLILVSDAVAALPRDESGISHLVM